MLLDPRNGEACDLPPFAGAPRVYVIASTPRTGSTLLCRALADTGRIGAPMEYLNPMQLRDWEVRLGARARHLPLRGPLLALVGRGPWPESRLRAHLDRVRARRTGPTGWFGLKLHFHHLQRWFLDPVQLLGPIRWIHVRRVDRVAQAVSWARALQTGRWASTQRAWMPPVYDRRLVARQLARIDAAEAGWEAFFAARGVAPLRLTYEEVAGDLEGAVRGVLGWLGEDPEVAVPDPALERQADAVSAAWIARFRERD